VSAAGIMEMNPKRIYVTLRVAVRVILYGSRRGQTLSNFDITWI
tara:strand:+ start:730 stop:861 length:132 start_codon:yes stop_codon:yes gene_type:complete